MNLFFYVIVPNINTIFICYNWFFRYLNRFDHEVSIIKARHKDKGNRRFASREDVIRHTIEREREEYNTAGIGECIKYPNSRIFLWNVSMFKSSK